MSDSTAATLPETPTLRRRNSITATSAAVPTKLSLPATAPDRSPSLELFSLKPSSSYTSLRDVLPPPNAAVNSPSAAAATAITYSGYEISIRNRLVKQAAWAYLQPMSSSPSTSSTPHFFSFLYHHLARFFRRILHLLCTRC
ncbi:hypothetical protein RJT34_19557 [Clitoria ternatea]|uniref:Uncharacterized protein n=1 Tax=Clitoria ternatea TaxID=43366 RepID=A0AAN9IRE5_CLITE